MADMLRRLISVIVVLAALFTAADAGQVRHPVDGPATSVTNSTVCWNNATGNAAKNCDFGVAGQCLTSNGPGVPPTYQPCPGAVGAGPFVLLNVGGHISLNVGGSVLCNAC